MKNGQKNGHKNGQSKNKVRVAIVGVGNCASSSAWARLARRT